MAGIPVKLTFDPSYPDHARALEILRAQKHTTQFVVNLIMGAACDITDTAPHRELLASNCTVTQVTDQLPTSNREVTQVTERTTLSDIPGALLGFMNEE